MGTPMNFSTVLMNPPYGNTHLKVLKNVIETLPDAQIVSLQPVRWLQDPLAENKKNSDFNKMKPVLKDKIESVYVIKSVKAQSLFPSTGMTFDLGIFNIKKNGKFKYNTLSKTGIDLKKIFKTFTCIEKLNFEKYDGTQKNFIPIMEIGGNNGGFKGFTENSKITRTYGYFINGKSCANKWKGQSLDEAFKNNPNVPRGDVFNWRVLSFKTEIECRNCWDFINLGSFRYFVALFQRDVHVPLKWLPFVNDYTKPWTNERFYKYFNLTDREIRIIEDWNKTNESF